MILEGKVILVTGGTGSLGEVLIKRLLDGREGRPKKIIIFSRAEDRQHAMRHNIAYKNYLSLLEFRIGDVSNYSDLYAAMQQAHIVINTAALKQVPICEYFPQQALDTNCAGALNIVRAIQEGKCPIETVIGISSNTAVKPVNVMGMTKALQERIFISANLYNPSTRFICVRYGSVVGSRGSVIPLFL